MNRNIKVLKNALDLFKSYLDTYATDNQDFFYHQASIEALAEIEKCEPVAEALHERNRLGYAVVDVIGTLDEIIENAQEVEVDDFLHIAIPIDKWNELQDALEEMPKRAELYTSQISKEWVGLSDQQIQNLIINSDNYNKFQFIKSVEHTVKQLNVPEKG